MCIEYQLANFIYNNGENEINEKNSDNYFIVQNVLNFIN